MFLTLQWSQPTHSLSCQLSHEGLDGGDCVAVLQYEGYVNHTGRVLLVVVNGDEVEDELSVLSVTVVPLTVLVAVTASWYLWMEASVIFPIQS